MPITDFLERNARLYPGEIALTEISPQYEPEKQLTWHEYNLIEAAEGEEYRREMTWRSFEEDANRFANLLFTRGIRRGDRVAILLMNCLEWLPIYFGILKTGALAVPMNYRYSAEEIRYCADAYNHFAADADGISGIRYERDEQGRVTRLNWLSFTASESRDAGKAENYEMIGKRGGEAGRAYLYDGSGDCTELHILDAEGQPITDEAYGAVTVYQYENHNELRRTCRDAEGGLFLNEEGYAVRESRYDDRGNRIRVSCFGTESEPVLCATQYTATVYTYLDGALTKDTDIHGEDWDLYLSTDEIHYYPLNDVSTGVYNTKITGNGKFHLYNKDNRTTFFYYCM